LPVPAGPVELACELVAAATPNPPGDERAAADVVVAHLRRLGIDDVRVVGPSPERPNVLARVPGSGGGPTLILNGHLDTKPPGDLAAWETPPWEPVVRDGRLYGLGAADMKGAVAAMTYAAAEIAEDEVAGDLVLVFTADEEAGADSGSRWLAAQGLLKADAAIIGEPSGITREWEALRLVSRGVLIFRIDVRGTQMHSSLTDELPSVNASTVMARLITRLADEAPGLLRYAPHALAPLGPTLNAALVAESGVGYGILSGAASFLSDIRLLPGMTQEGIVEDLELFMARVRADDPDLDATLTVEHWLPPCEIAPDHPVVVGLAAAAAEVLGAAPPFAAFPGGTDAPYLQLDAGILTVPSCGPGLLTAAHRPNEWISVQGILEATDLYTRTARRYLDG
jgi:acetylornithine deacetylase